MALSTLVTACLVLAVVGARELVAPGAVSLGGSANVGAHNFHIDGPPHGFFIGGSSIDALNGVYGPRLDDVPPHIAPYVVHGAYRHDSGNGYMLAHLRTEGGEEWVIIDPSSRDRFGHPGGAHVPGSGPSWVHLHRAPRLEILALDGSDPEKAPERALVAGDAGDDPDELPWQA